MGLQNANDNRDVYDRGGVHRSIHQLEGGYPHHGDGPGYKGAWTSGGIPASKGALHSLRGQ